MHVEILPLEGKVEYLGQMITFMDQEKKLSGCSAGSAVPGPRSPDIDRNGHPSLACSDTGYTSLTLLSHQQ